jgi:hypothetical protein
MRFPPLNQARLRFIFVPKRHFSMNEDKTTFLFLV